MSKTDQVTRCLQWRSTALLWSSHMLPLLAPSCVDTTNSRYSRKTSQFRACNVDTELHQYKCFIAIIPVNPYQQPQLRTGGFCCSKVLLPAWPRQLVHLDQGEDARVLLSGVTCTVSVPYYIIIIFIIIAQIKQLKSMYCNFFVVDNYASNRHGHFRTDQLRRNVFNYELLQ